MEKLGLAQKPVHTSLSIMTLAAIPASGVNRIVDNDRIKQTRYLYIGAIALEKSKCTRGNLNKLAVLVLRHNHRVLALLPSPVSLVALLQLVVVPETVRAANNNVRSQTVLVYKQ